MEPDLTPRGAHVAEVVAIAAARDAALQAFRTAAFDALRFGADPVTLLAIVRAEVREAEADDPTPPADRPRQTPKLLV